MSDAPAPDRPTTTDARSTPATAKPKPAVKRRATKPAAHRRTERTSMADAENGTQQTDSPKADDVERDAVRIQEYETKLQDARDAADLPLIEELQGEYTKARTAKLKRDRDYAKKEAK